MRLRRALLSIAALGPLLAVTSPAPTGAAIDPADEVVALVIEGVGFGHGRGMSQWGAYGWAVNYGQTWQWILDHYYGGTTLGSVSTSSRIRVRLVAHDDDPTVGVISTTSRAMWGGTGYPAVQARQTATPGRYDVYTSATVGCPGTATTGWTLRSSNVAGPITFTTNLAETATPAGNVLGLCNSDGSVTHYRGSIQLVRDSAGANRVVNDINVENYIRGVISREVSTSWGNAGGGAGMNALRAQAVAARSYGVSQNRYVNQGGYATTCDSTACQAYGGAARRPSPTAATSSGGTCESGNATFECANTNQAVTDTAGRVRRFANGSVAATEFSASNGPRTAGGTFPAVDDPADDVAANPNHRWTRIVDAHLVASAFGLGQITSAFTEPDPTMPFDGVWDNRVRIVGTTGTRTFSALDFRSTYGFPSHGFVIRAVTRDVVSSNSMRLIGDSVGLSMTEGMNSELPALLDGVFTPASYDAVVNRCTSGCGLSGVGAAASVPIGTDVVVVELGYNAPTDNFGARIDAMMNALQARQVERVVWINLSERSGRADYVAVNQALAAATNRWADLFVIDWRAASAGSSGNRNRWFASDQIHLTSTGQAEMARFVRDQLVPLADFPVGSSIFTWDRNTGAWAVRSMTNWLFRIRSQATWSTVYDDVVAGDFDRDGELDELFVWDRNSGSWAVKSSVNHTPTDRQFGQYSRVYDQIIVGDFDRDGRRNELFLWDHDTGNWVIHSFHLFAPAYRSRGTFSRVYDTMVVGDWDGDGFDNDAMVWDQTTGNWVVQSFAAFKPAYRGRGTFSRVYDQGIQGDFDGDGRRDELALLDVQTGSIVVQSWWRFTPIYRGRVQASSTIDLGVAADLDDDGRFNELLLYDRDAGGWNIYRWSAFVATLARAGTFPAGYDVLLEGLWA
jgi:peptidoglycan hydrolase-like amidase